MTDEYSGWWKLLNDWQSFLGSVLGGIIGALGAAAGAAKAVHCTLAGQRREDRKRIRDAIIGEVIEFARLAIGHLEICNNIHAGINTMPVPKLAEMMQMPAPIIYPAVADKIGLLKAPHRVVSFYTGIAGIATGAQALAADPKRQTAYLQADDVKLIVEEWLVICQFASWLIQDSDVGKEFDKAVSARILSDIDEITAAARKNFQIYLYALRTRKSAGLMMRKLSETESQ